MLLRTRFVDIHWTCSDLRYNTAENVYCRGLFLRYRADFICTPRPWAQSRLQIWGTRECRSPPRTSWPYRFFWASRFLANVNVIRYNVARPSVTLVRPTHAASWNVRQCFYAILVPWLPVDIHGKFYGNRPMGTHRRGRVKRKMGSQI